MRKLQNVKDTQCEEALAHRQRWQKFFKHLLGNKSTSSYNQYCPIKWYLENNLLLFVKSGPVFQLFPMFYIHLFPN